MQRLIPWSIAILAAIALVACRGGGDPPPLPPEPEPDPLAPLASSARLYYDNSGGIADSIRMVVRDEAEWEDLWTRATSRQSSPPPRPQVDFGEEMVVAVGAGRMTPQDRIQVDSAGYYDERTVDGAEEQYFLVVVRTVQGCRRLDSDAFPLEIVKVPRFEGTVRWEERTERDTDCQDEEARLLPERPATPALSGIGDPAYRPPLGAAHP
jgi:hypothetical protein